MTEDKISENVEGFVKHPIWNKGSLLRVFVNVKENVENVAKYMQARGYDRARSRFPEPLELHEDGIEAALNAEQILDVSKLSEVTLIELCTREITRYKKLNNNEKNFLNSNQIICSYEQR